VISEQWTEGRLFAIKIKREPKRLSHCCFKGKKSAFYKNQLQKGIVKGETLDRGY
jgi:hypothetical protein